MNTAAIVKVLWIGAVFSTSALVIQALTDSRNPGPIVFEPVNRAPSDAGTQIPRGYAIGSSDMTIAWSSWDSTL